MHHIPGHSYHEVSLNDDDEGRVIATFISSDQNTHTKPAVLYVHGFIDYFFQQHVSEELTANGYDFYALELRKYGHSLLPHQRPNFCQNMEEYYEEMTKAIALIKEQNRHPLVLMGHSTGGLLTSAYVNWGPLRNQVNALVLNSPFLELNIPNYLRPIAVAAAKWISKIRPFASVSQALTPVYPKSVHAQYNGEWQFDLSYKPLNGFPLFFSWVAAIAATQDALKAHSHISIPVLLMHSSSSLITSIHSNEVMNNDIVLNVAHMKKIGPKLGADVTLLEIENGMHDLFLSRKEVRKKALSQMISWLNQTLYSS